MPISQKSDLPEADPQKTSPALRLSDGLGFRAHSKAQNDLKTS